MRKAHLVLYALVGGLVVHFSVVACSAGASSSTDGPEPDAHAQTNTATPCTSWKTARFVAPGGFPVTLDGSSNLETGVIYNDTTIPDGWEPYAISPYYVSTSADGSSGSVIYVRKCAR